MSKQVRLDKFLCHTLDMTRKEAKAFIAKEEIYLDNLLLRRPEAKVDINDCLLVKGEKITYEPFCYYMLNKPKGVVSATKDREHDTVLSLINEPMIKELFPVGRLDRDTEGLLLITNDGVLAHELLSPKKHVEKVYEARVQGCIDEHAVEAFAHGIDLGHGVLTRPAKLSIVESSHDESVVRITLTEGKFHQVKRMIYGIGSEVITLKRMAMGPLVLDERLAPGEYRSLTTKEIELLKEERC